MSQYGEDIAQDNPSGVSTLLRECGDAVEKLGGMLNQLEERLAPVRRPVPAEKLVDKTTPAHPIRSRLVNELDEHLGQLRDLQVRVLSISDEIEL